MRINLMYNWRECIDNTTIRVYGENYLRLKEQQQSVDK